MSDTSHEALAARLEAMRAEFDACTSYAPFYWIEQYKQLAADAIAALSTPVNGDCVVGHATGAEELIASLKASTTPPPEVAKCSQCGSTSAMGCNSIGCFALEGQDRPPNDTLQQRVQPWLMACFGPAIAADKTERNHRFLEEALELVQACGCTQSEAHQLVDYVFGRPVGERGQEVGGVMITLAALCLAQGLDMHAEGETELARIWTMVEKIRAKQAAKPKHSPLPVAWDAAQIKQPGWHHVQQAFIDGAREARCNPEASDAVFYRAADGYTKRVFEDVDPVSEAALRTESWAPPEGREERMVVVSRNAKGIPTVWCDPEIVDLVTALNAGGLKTDWSCSGHGYRPGVIGLVDGRQIVIAKDMDEMHKINTLFPLDINGQPVPPVPAGGEVVRIPAPWLSKLSWAAHIFGSTSPPHFARASYARALHDLRSAHHDLSNWSFCAHPPQAQSTPPTQPAPEPPDASDFSRWVVKAYRDAYAPGSTFTIANMHVAYVAGENRNELRHASRAAQPEPKAQAGGDMRITEQQALLFEQAIELLHDYSIQQFERGNDSIAKGAECSAHMLEGLRVALAGKAVAHQPAQTVPVGRESQLESEARGKYEVHQGATVYVSWRDLPEHVREFWRTNKRAIPEAKAQPAGAGLIAAEFEEWRSIADDLLSMPLNSFKNTFEVRRVANALQNAYLFASTVTKTAGTPPEQSERWAIERKQFNRAQFDAPAFFAAVQRAMDVRGVEAKQLAVETGISETTLSRMRSGDRVCDAASLAALCGWAGINPANYCPPLHTQLLTAQADGQDAAARGAIYTAKWLSSCRIGRERLKAVVEGECDGLALTDKQADAILEYISGWEDSYSQNDVDAAIQGPATTPQPSPGTPDQVTVSRVEYVDEAMRLATRAATVQSAYSAAIGKLVVTDVDGLQRQAEAAFMDLRAHLASMPATAVGELPNPGSPTASAMMDSVLAEYNYPSNPKNAARAGYVAAQRLLSAPAPSEQAETSEGSSDVDLWSRYVAGMVVSYLGGTVDDMRISPIAGIIKRRLHHLGPQGAKQVTPAAAPGDEQAKP